MWLNCKMGTLTKIKAWQYTLVACKYWNVMILRDEKWYSLIQNHTIQQRKTHWFQYLVFTTSILKEGYTYYWKPHFNYNHVLIGPILISCLQLKRILVKHIWCRFKNDHFTNDDGYITKFAPCIFTLYYF